MIKNPYNPTIEPSSHQWWEEVKRPLLEKKNSDYESEPVKENNMEKIILTPQQLKDFLRYKDVKGFEGWGASANHESGDFDSEKGAMINYEIELISPEEIRYIAHDGYYTGPTGDCFDHGDIEFLKVKEIKTSSITLDSIKCTDGWYQVGNELGFDDDKINKVFEYGEYGNIEIIIDENLNIIGGKVIPHSK